MQELSKKTVAHLIESRPTIEPFTISPEMTIYDAAKKMTELDVGLLVVTDKSEGNLSLIHI